MYAAISFIVDKQSILERVTQEQIFEYYLGVSVVFGVTFCSPLRTDKNPTCAFYYAKNGKLYFRDYSGFFWGDCFDLVQFIYHCSFKDALYLIAKDFNLIELAVDGMQPHVNSGPEHATRESKKIQIKKREFKKEDITYWSSFCLESKSLEKYRVYPCQAVWVDGHLVYTYNKEDPAYAYCFSRGRYKIYFPKRRRYRFLSNASAFQGYAQLPAKGELLIITKSLKDVMVLDHFGIISVSPPSESSCPPDEFIEEMLSRFDRVYTLYDFDLAGIRTANQIRRRFGIPALFLTNGRFHSVARYAKDAAEYAARNGEQRTISLIAEFYAAINYRDTSIHYPCNLEPEQARQILQGHTTVVDPRSVLYGVLPELPETDVPF